MSKEQSRTKELAGLLDDVITLATSPDIANKPLPSKQTITDGIIDMIAIGAINGEQGKVLLHRLVDANTDDKLKVFLIVMATLSISKL